MDEGGAQTRPSTEGVDGGAPASGGAPGHLMRRQGIVAGSAEREVAAAMRRAKRMLPRGSRFAFSVAPGEIRLDVLRVSKPGGGVGRAFLGAIVAIADKAGLPCRLVADASMEPDEPSVDDLVRFYSSLGFEITGRDDDTGGSPVMVREPRA